MVSAVEFAAPPTDHEVGEKERRPRRHLRFFERCTTPPAALEVNLRVSVQARACIRFDNGNAGERNLAVLRGGLDERLASEDGDARKSVARDLRGSREHTRILSLW